jgi:glycosyltransferase involved in cell wall biosynthesis
MQTEENLLLAKKKLNIPYFSICIPTYNSVFFLEKVLNSIRNQTFKEFEIIISDDSKSSTVEDYVNKRIRDFEHLHFFKGPKNGCSTANWNNALNISKGRYRILMHHDDYFNSNIDLESLHKVIEENNLPEILFLSFQNERKAQKLYYGKYILGDLLDSPRDLLFVNYFSSPSCLVMSDSVSERYDANLKWLVDVEFYYRLVKKYSNLVLVDSIFVIIGGGQDRITHHVTTKLILDEYYYLLKQRVFRHKIGLAYIFYKKIIIMLKHMTRFYLKNIISQ